MTVEEIRKAPPGPKLDVLYAGIVRGAKVSMDDDEFAETVVRCVANWNSQDDSRRVEIKIRGEIFEWQFEELKQLYLQLWRDRAGKPWRVAIETAASDFTPHWFPAISTDQAAADAAESEFSGSISYWRTWDSHRRLWVWYCNLLDFEAAAEGGENRRHAFAIARILLELKSRGPHFRSPA